MNIPPLRTNTREFIEIKRTNYELRENVSITSTGKIGLTLMPFQSFPHLMNIPPLTTYIPIFIEIHKTNYDLRKITLIKS
jgi:hypothetical protein